MNRTRDNKPHIGIFGRRNTGKSSFINALVGQEIAIVSEQAGTTTDPVKKSIEIFGIGPAIVVDTAGIDDVGELGEKRIEKSLQVLKTVDCAVLMISENTFEGFEEDLIKTFDNFEVPYILVHNKSDEQPLEDKTRIRVETITKAELTDFSAREKHNLEKVIASLKNTIPESVFQKPKLLGDLIGKGDYVLLITPIDNEAPDGRMILPQVMAIRDVLDNDAINIVLKEDQVENFFKTSGIKPKLAITDSQVFGKMKDIVPAFVPFTSFSIMLARFRGDFEAYLKGTPKIGELQDGDRVLILESCTHQVNCDDIGRYKLPKWISEYTGKKIDFDIVAGLDKITRDPEDYKLLIQCGGCMVTRKQLWSRLKPAKDAEIAISNYGMAIAWVNGMFDRVTEPFRKVYA
ncbi:MAG: [FeFe] hydrogenase H-cluster maturation GTPase HydF [Bacteroidales bacterium]|nr:[FeFe] hydrogenase H-cluster maturation GTPase HydF [Bacteroidales bacterium]